MGGGIIIKSTLRILSENDLKYVACSASSCPVCLSGLVCRSTGRSWWVATGDKGQTTWSSLHLQFPVQYQLLQGQPQERKLQVPKASKMSKRHELNQWMPAFDANE